MPSPQPLDDDKAQKLIQDVLILAKQFSPLFIRTIRVLYASWSELEIVGWYGRNFTFLLHPNQFENILKNFEGFFINEFFNLEVTESIKPLIKNLPFLIQGMLNGLIQWQLHSQTPDARSISTLAPYLKAAFLQFIEDNKTDWDNFLEQTLKSHGGYWAILSKLIPNSLYKFPIFGFLKLGGFLSQKTKKRLGKFIIYFLSGASSINPVAPLAQHADSEDFALNRDQLIPPLKNLIKLFSPMLIQILKNALSTDKTLAQLQANLIRSLNLGSASDPIIGISVHINSLSRVNGFIDFIIKHINDEFIDALFEQLNDTDLQKAQHLVKNLVGAAVASEINCEFQAGAYSRQQASEVLKTIMVAFEQLLQKQITDPTLPPFYRRIAAVYSAFSNTLKIRTAVTQLCTVLHDRLQAKLNAPATMNYYHALEIFNKRLGSVLLSNSISDDQVVELTELFNQVIQTASRFQDYVASLKNAKQLRTILDKIDNNHDLSHEDCDVLFNLGLIQDRHNFIKIGNNSIQKLRELKTSILYNEKVHKELWAAGDEYPHCQILESNVQALIDNQDTIRTAITSKNLVVLKDLHTAMTHLERQLSHYILKKQPYKYGGSHCFDFIKAWVRGTSLEDIKQFEKTKQHHADKLKQLMKTSYQASTLCILGNLSAPDAEPSIPKPKREDFNPVIEKINFIREYLESEHRKHNLKRSDLGDLCNAIEGQIDSLTR